MKTVTGTGDICTQQGETATSTGTPKQWDAFPQPKGWSLEWDGGGLGPPKDTIAPKS